MRTSKETKAKVEQARAEALNTACPIVRKVSGIAWRLANAWIFEEYNISSVALRDIAIDVARTMVEKGKFVLVILEGEVFDAVCASDASGLEVEELAVWHR